MFILLSGLTALQAQEITSAIPGPPAVRVHGEATVPADPDQAEFDLGVVTEGANVQTATETNASQIRTVMQQLRAILPNGDIKTINFSVNPNYQYPKEGGPAIINGYTASNTVRLVLVDLALLAKVIEIALHSGANTINRLTFTLKDESPVRARALANAASQAQAGAEALATSLKFRLGRLIRVEEGQPVVVSPARQFNFGRAESTDMTPIAPGTINIHADVNLTYEILDQDRNVKSSSGKLNSDTSQR